jgi:uncharacterized protein YdcH (DUF465 family)
MNLNTFKREHKQLKTQVNEAETIRQLDRTSSAWKSLKDLKKMKLMLKDKLVGEKR